MKLVWGSFSQLLFCGLDIFFVSSFLGSMFSRRLKKSKFLAVSLIMAVCVFIVNTFGNTLLNLTIVPIIFIIYTRITFNISYINSIVYVLIYSIIFAMGREAAFEMLLRALVIYFPDFLNVLFASNSTLLLALEYLFSFIFLLYIKKYTSKLNIDEHDKVCIYLLVMPATSLIILMILVYMEPIKDGIMQVLVCIGTFMLYFSNAAIYIILEKYTETMNSVKEMEMAEIRGEMVQTNYENIEKINDEYRKHLHDIHKYFNQIRTLAAVGEDEIIVGIVDEVEGKLKTEIKQKIYSSSPVLNAILSEFESKAKEKEVKVEILVQDGLKTDYILDNDKIIIFGNLLDNALEATEQCPPDKRDIRLDMFMWGSGILAFHMENTYVVKPKKVEGNWLSTKKNAENHGLGVEIVKRLADKYNGKLELEETEEKVITTLMLSKIQSIN